MQNIILNQLSQCFKGKLIGYEAFNLSLLLLAWAKLSVSKLIPNELRISDSSVVDLAYIRRIFEILSQTYPPFQDSHDLEEIDSTRLQEAISIVKNTISTGVIDAIDGISFEEYHSSLRDSLWFMPSGLPDLLIQLASPIQSASVYIPWDSTGTLACRASKESASVHLENPSPRLAMLNKIISGKDFEIRNGEPVTRPSYVDEGKLKTFDVSISVPPFALRYDDVDIFKDWYGRFNLFARSGDVFLLQHLLSVTKGKIVVTVANNILFSVGAERQLREGLVSGGYVEAIINLPSGLFEYTNVNTSVIILNANKKSQNIRFLDADIDLFKEQTGRTKSKLRNLDLIIDAVKSDVDREYSRSVSIDEVRANGYQLQATRYVLPAEALRAQDFLKSAKTTKLKNIVEIVRPIIGRAQVEGIDAYEVSGVDFPEYGEIIEVNRAIKLDDAVAADSHKQFLRPNDIVLMTKGNAGRVGIVGSEVPKPGIGGWIAGQSAVVLRVKSGNPIDAKGLFMQLRSPLGQAILKTVISGATIQLIQQRELIELEVISPDDKKFDHAARMLDEETNYQNQILNLRNVQQKIAKELWTY